MDRKGRLSLSLKRAQHSQTGAEVDTSQTKSVASMRPQPCSGLRNLGNTCYCNAVLQALRHCPGFSLELKRMSRAYFQKCGEKDIVCQLNQLVQKMEDSSIIVSPINFVDLIRQKELFAGRAQHDAQELLNFLLTQSLLETPLPYLRKRKGSTPLNEDQPIKLFRTSQGCKASKECKNSSYDCQIPSVAALFQGRLSFQTRCFDCDKCTIRTEPFLHVSVPVTSPGVPGFPSSPELSECSTKSLAAPVSLSWGLSRFMSHERLTWSNKFWCDYCGHLVEAERSILFSNLPKIFTVHLNRFSLQDWGRAIGKVAGSVAIPMSLCFSPWSTYDCTSRNSMYYLRAAVLHSGASCHSGHYTAVVQAQETQWLHCDDETVQQLSESTVQELLSPLPTKSASDPYILFYCRL